jgi:hypothetical protein
MVLVMIEYFTHIRVILTIDHKPDRRDVVIRQSRDTYTSVGIAEP